MPAINFNIKKRNCLSCYYYQPCEYLRMILFTSVFWINSIFLTLFRNCVVWVHRKLKITVMYVGNVCAWKDWGRDITDCTDNQAVLASFWGASHHSLVKYCVALCLSGGTHVPEAVNILCSCEVQGNLYMLLISVREVLVLSGKIIFSHISERLGNAWNYWRKVSEGHFFPFAEMENSKTLINQMVLIRLLF